MVALNMLKQYKDFVWDTLYCIVLALNMLKQYKDFVWDTLYCIILPLFQVITASGRQVTNPDQAAENGVIHVVDGVLLPPTGTVTDYVAGNDDFSTLLSAVTTAGLGDTLAGKTLI